MSTKTAYFGMQCFWGSESIFAKVSGVKGTAVGYAGGEGGNPTYRIIKDYTEVVAVKYDPSAVNYDKLLRVFWKNHDPTVHRKKQYQSAILWQTEEERDKVQASYDAAKIKIGKDIETYIKKFDRFYHAEDYHQKYWLRCQDSVLKALNFKDDKEIIESKLAAKVNAFMAGFDDFELLDQLAVEYAISDDVKKIIKEIAISKEHSACH
uniref:Peptide-methionine (S)-S-oxide reductase n=1 Tax=Rhabditophanes sp. KR3021 TaxID=114890 RepID=A0AC35U7N9_9BILA